MDICVAQLWQVMAQGWPGATSERLGDWLLKYGYGFTWRANSATVLGDPGLPLADAVAEVERRYAAHRLMPMLHLAYPLAGMDDATRQVDDLVHALGWSAPIPALAMTASTVVAPEHLTGGPGDISYEFSSIVTPEWDLAYFGRMDPDARAGARAVVTASPASYLVVRRAGSMIGRGRVAHVGTWCGLTDFEVDPVHRRQGIGRRAMAEMLRHGARHGARHAYLHVLQSNLSAIALYEAMGWVRHSAYHYRVAG